MRKFNPRKSKMPYGTNMENEVQGDCNNACNNNPILCCYCRCIGEMWVGIDETCEHACDGRLTIQDYVEKQREQGDRKSKIIMFVGWLIGQIALTLILTAAEPIRKYNLVYTLLRKHQNENYLFYFAILVNLFFCILLIGAGKMSSSRLLGGLMFALGLITTSAVLFIPASLLAI
jgi:hypothetical protein